MKLKCLTKFNLRFKIKKIQFKVKYEGNLVK